MFNEFDKVLDTKYQVGVALVLILVDRDRGKVDHFDGVRLREVINNDQETRSFYVPLIPVF